MFRTVFCRHPSWRERINVLFCVYLVPHPQSIVAPMDPPQNTGGIQCLWYISPSLKEEFLSLGTLWKEEGMGLNQSQSVDWHMWSKAQFYLLEHLENSVLDLTLNFAHAVKGTLKGTEYMLLHNLFQMNEYFILMNNKYAFFLLGDVALFFSLLLLACLSLSLFLSLIL